MTPRPRPLLYVLDSGFATLGGALLEGDGSLVEVDTFASEPGERPSKAVGSWAAEERVRRVRLARTWLTRLRIFGDQDGSIVAFGAEANPGSKDAGACIALGAAAGLIGGIADELHLDPVLALPSDWRAPYMVGYWPDAKPPPASKKEGPEAKRARLAWRRKNRADEDRHLYERIGSAPATSSSAKTTEAFVLARLKTWARRPSSKPHALDAVGLGRWLLIHSRKIRHAMGLAPLDAATIVLEDLVLGGMMERAA